jgi:hypothetical protein
VEKVEMQSGARREGEQGPTALRNRNASIKPWEGSIRKYVDISMGRLVQGEILILI